MSYSAFARYYDLLTDNISYSDRADYFDTILKTYATPGPILLDLACGTGNLSFEFARRGYDVIGVDGSPEMLSAAMQKQDLDFDQDQGTQKKVLFLCQQMDALDLYGTIDVAVCALDSLNHITNQKVLQRVFGRVRLFLNPGGLFVFDVNSIYKHQKVLGNQTFVFDREEVYCVWQNGPVQPDNSVSIQLDFFEYQKKQNAYFRSSERFSERAYSHQAICAFLEANSLELVACYGDDSFEPVHEQTERVIYVARCVG